MLECLNSFIFVIGQCFLVLNTSNIIVLYKLMANVQVKAYLIVIRQKIRIRLEPLLYENYIQTLF